MCVKRRVYLLLFWSGAGGGGSGAPGSVWEMSPVLGTTAHLHRRPRPAAQQPGIPRLRARECSHRPGFPGAPRGLCVTAGLSQHCHLQRDSPLVPWEVEGNDGLQFPEILGPSPGIVSKGTRVGSSKPETGFLPQLFVSSWFLRTWTDEGAGPGEGMARNGRGEPQTTGSLYWGSPGGNDYTGRPMSVISGLRVGSGLRP